MVPQAPKLLPLQSYLVCLRVLLGQRRISWCTMRSVSTGLRDVHLEMLSGQLQGAQVLPEEGHCVSGNRVAWLKPAGGWGMRWGWWFPSWGGSPESAPPLGISSLGWLTAFLIASKLIDQSKLKVCNFERFNMKKFNCNHNPLTLLQES